MISQLGRILTDMAFLGRNQRCNESISRYFAYIFYNFIPHRHARETKVMLLCLARIVNYLWSFAMKSDGDFSPNITELLNAHPSRCRSKQISCRERICYIHLYHNIDVIMSKMASQITSLATVYATVYSGADQRKHQSSASLAFVHGIQRWPVNSPHKGPVTRKMFPFDDVIM